MAAKFSLASTREAYGKALLELGRENPDIVVVGGDLNVSTFVYLFAQEFPERFFDFGPAEQNMMSVAAGLASSGKVPFVSTFVVFGTSRPFDQMRVGIAQPRLGVKIVCSHAGITTGEDGMSAHGIEDLALMSSLPGFTVVAPCDSVETAKAVRAIAEIPGPAYMRVYRTNLPVVHGEDYVFTLGRAEKMRDGTDVTIIAIGSMVAAALQAADELLTGGVRCRVLNMHTLRPVDEEAIVEAAGETGALVTAEEHLRHGGLASTVAEVLAHRAPAPLEVVALQGYAESGSPADLLEKYGLTAGDIKKAVRRVLSRK